MFKTTCPSTLNKTESVNDVCTSFCQPCLEVQQLIKHIIQNPFTKNDLIIVLELVYDINRLRGIKKTLEEKIEILNEAKNHLLNSKRRMNQY